MTVMRRVARARWLTVLGVLAALTAATLPATAQQTGEDLPIWTEADKDGFGTAVGADSKLWFTLDDGRLTEVYHPRLDRPSVRQLQLIVTDGKSFAELETEATDQTIELVDERALLYRQVNTARSGRYRITKTYATDPARDTLLIDVRFESLDGGRYDVYVLHDPQLANTGGDDSGRSTRGGLIATDGATDLAGALVARPGFGHASNGIEGADDGWMDLRDDYRLDERARTAGPGDVIQTAKLRLRRGHTHTRQATLALGFGGDAADALRTARASLRQGFRRIAGAYADGWHDYLDGLPARPDSVAQWPVEYDVSMMVLKASEDKTYAGASVASPSMPWAWGLLTIHNPSGPYHLVWPRDLYGVATAMLAAGDRESAEHALDFLFDVQQLPDGSFPQNSEVDGTPFWTELQLDEVAFPLILAWQLDRDDPDTVRDHVEPAADFIVANGPATDQERWEEEAGYSPSTIAAEIAGLVAAADLTRRVGDDAKADTYEQTADAWQAAIEDWLVTDTGPLGDGRYYLRINDDTDPDDGAELELNNGAGVFDERAVVDAGFLELVRLGIKPADDPAILASLPEVDAELRRETPNGPVWYRYSHDGYGETDAGVPWDLEVPDTIGRLWPILTGERGEYELADGRSATEHLDTIARTANEGYMMPEQVWDRAEPEPDGFRFGEGTESATPLGWTHAQFVRLAWSIDAGAPVETPAVVACRYVRDC
jgi:glucoamylase